MLPLEEIFYTTPDSIFDEYQTSNMDELSLFAHLQKSKSNREIADLLLVHKGTVDRWDRIKQVPDFYRNDLLRILNLNGEYNLGIKQADQYYTMPDVAKSCINRFYKTLDKYNIDISDYTFVEPSAGCGHFYSLLPENNRLGIEIQPKKSPLTDKLIDGIIQADFLTWQPPAGKYVVIGNPPFGRNGKIALDFVVKSFEFADYVAFILPPIFDSTGKGSCKNRLIKMGYILLHTETLNDNPFIFPNGEEINVKTVFQVWAKSTPSSYKPVNEKSCRTYVDIYNICIPYKPSRFPSRMNMIGKCDIYLPRTFWARETAVATTDFYDIPYNDGYGIVIKRKKKSVFKFIKNHDWASVVHTSTNNSRSLRKDIIYDELIKVGFMD